MRISKPCLKQYKQGMTLIEVVVAMFIFTIVVVSVMSTFVTLLRKHSDVKKMQQQTEESSLIMSYMAKKIRTSKLVNASDCTGTSCKVLDNNTNANVTFTFTNANTLTENGTVILSNVSGGFATYNTGPNQIPFVTMHLMTGGSATAVQTTVSLRSY